LPFGAGGPAAGCGSAATVGSTATVAAADREPSPPLAGAGVRWPRRTAQISSFKDAMVCVGDVVQIVELLYTFLQERAYLDSEEAGVGPSRGNSRQLDAASGPGSSGGMVAQGTGNADGRSNGSGSLLKSRAAPSPPGRCGPGGPSTVTPKPTPTPASPSAGAAAGARAGTVLGLPARTPQQTASRPTVAVSFAAAASDGEPSPPLHSVFLRFFPSVHPTPAQSRQHFPLIVPRRAYALRLRRAESAPPHTHTLSLMWNDVLHTTANCTTHSKKIMGTLE